MSRKLTIRRVGSHVPTVCLVGFLFLCITVGWLSLVGLPDSILRKVERIASEHGVPLRLEAIRLAPYQGLALKAEGIRIYSTPEEEVPLLRARSATVAISAFRLLFMGDVSLKSAELKRAHLNLPVTDSPGEHLQLSDVLISTTITPGGDIRINSARINLEGIDLRLSGDIDSIPRCSDSATAELPEEQSKIDLPVLLEKISPYTSKVYHTIQAQNWTPQEMPHLRCHLTISHDTHITIHAEVPRFDYDIFKFRKAKADFAFKNNTITIHNLSFETIEPPSSATLQGAYDMQLRHLGFDFRSNAALVPMITEMLGKENVGILQKLRHAPDKAPIIKLKGTIGFEPNFSLSSLILNGELEQRELYVDDILIDNLTLGFFYKDGNFNLNSLRIKFDDNHISLTATANEGEGQARLSANLNVENTLSLINKFTTEPIHLPNKIRVGERIKLQASASLTTPDFTPGQTDWQEFTPDIHQLTLTLEPDSLEIDNTRLLEPSLSLELSGLCQDAHKVPTGAKRIALAMSAREFRHEAQVTAEDVDIRLSADNISYRNEELHVARIKLLPGEKSFVHHLSAGSLLFSDTMLSLQLDDVSYKQNLLHISEAEATATSEAIQHGNMLAEKVTLEMKNLSELRPLARTLSDIFKKAEIRGEIGRIAFDNRKLGVFNMELALAEGQKGKAALAFSALNNTNSINAVSSDIDWTNPDTPALSNIELNLTPASLQEVLEHFRIDIPQLNLPETIQARGTMVLNTQTGKPEKADFHITIPHLERIPVRVAAFGKSPVSIGVDADISLRPADKENYDYTARLKVTHLDDCFEGSITGNTRGWLQVNGNNTIRADVVDRLIDSQTAHSIIRDFNFTDGSRNIVTDIDVKVDYSAGLSVDSFCNVELKRVGYQLGVILEDSDGKEKLRTDLGKNPYTLADRATCYVRARVRYPEQKEGVKQQKDECVVTIGDIFMSFDNEPWFARQQFNDLIPDRSKLSKILNAHKKTSMTGDAVIIDVENSFVELVNIKGIVFPAYSLGMYYAPLQHFLADMVLPYPAKVETQSCVFPIYSDCRRPMSGLIRTEIQQKAGFRFLGTTIPLERFSGFIRLTDDYVMLDRMNAACWEGVLNAMVKIDFSGTRTAFDGYVNAGNMNLKSILASYGTEYSSALCNGTLRFHSPTPDIEDIQGYGNVSVVNGDLMGFTLFQPIASLVSDLPSTLRVFESAVEKRKEEVEETGSISNIFSGTGKAITSIGNQARYIPGYNHLFAYDIQDVHAKFAIANGYLRAYDMKALGYNLNVKMKLLVDLNTTYIRGNLWPSITSLPTIVLSPITFLSNFMIDILVYGKIDDLQWKFGLDKRLKGTPPSATSAKQDKKYRPKKKAKEKR